MALICPSCNRPYIRIGTLLNPTRTIYIHRQTKKNHEPVEYCMGMRKGKGRVKGASIKKELDMDANDSVVSAVGLASERVAGSSYHMASKSETTETKGKEDKIMAFKAFSKAALQAEFPVTIGRTSDGKARMTISASGQISFNKAASDLLAGCTVAQLSYDEESRRLRFDGLKEAPKGKESNYWELRRGKKEGNQKLVSLSGTLICKRVEYDYHAAGNQTYEASKVDAEKHALMFVLPAETPAPKPVVKRAKKTAEATSTVAVGSTNASAKSEGDEVVVDE